MLIRVDHRLTGFYHQLLNSIFFVNGQEVFLKALKRNARAELLILVRESTEVLAIFTGPHLKPTLGTLGSSILLLAGNLTLTR